MHVVSECPVCGNKKFDSLFSCTDFTVSHETFLLVKCNSCGLVATSPRPVNEDLGEYYLSIDYISHSSESQSFLDRVYRTARNFTLRWKYNLIKKYSKKTGSLNILDCGCGTGNFLIKCKSEGNSIAGVEPSRQARSKAIHDTNAQIVDSLYKVTGQFDVITLWHVLEHIPDLNETLAKLHSLLAENGTVFIAVPNHLSKDAKHYKSNWAGYDVPRHLWHFTQKTMSKLLEKNSFTQVKVLPMKLDAFYVSMLSEKYIRKNATLTGLAKAMIQGLTSNFGARTSKEYSSLIYIARKK